MTKKIWMFVPKNHPRYDEARRAASGKRALEVEVDLERLSPVARRMAESIETTLSNTCDDLFSDACVVMRIVNDRRELEAAGWTDERIKAWERMYGEADRYRPHIFRWRWDAWRPQESVYDFFERHAMTVANKGGVILGNPYHDDYRKIDVEHGRANWHVKHDIAGNIAVRDMDGVVWWYSPHALADLEFCQYVRWQARCQTFVSEKATLDEAIKSAMAANKDYRGREG